MFQYITKHFVAQLNKMKSTMLLPVVAVTLLACNSCILANGNSHLRKRLNIMESKVSLDSIEFREGIERLTSSLNRTCNCNDKQTDTDGTTSSQVDADMVKSGKAGQSAKFGQ